LDGRYFGLLGDVGTDGLAGVELTHVPVDAMELHNPAGGFRVPTVATLEATVTAMVGQGLDAYDTTAPDTEIIDSARSAIIVSSELVSVLLTRPSWDLVSLYAQVLKPIVDGGDAVVHQELVDWYRVVVTKRRRRTGTAAEWNPMVNCLENHAAIATLDRARAREFVRRFVCADLPALTAPAAPALDTHALAALTTGLARLSDSHELSRGEETARSEAAVLRKQEEAEAKGRISSSKKTLPMCQGLKALLSLTDDVSLNTLSPSFWQEYAKSPELKGDQPLLARHYDARAAAATSVVQTAGSVPVATIKRINLVRGGMFGSPAVDNLGLGLSLFTTRTSLEPEGVKAAEKALIFSRCEHGSTAVSHLDQLSLMEHDGVSFPSTPGAMGERLKCYSVEMDVLLGDNHSVAVDVRQAVELICGNIFSLEQLFPDHGKGLLMQLGYYLHLRIMLYFNQVQAAAGGARDPTDTTLFVGLQEIFSLRDWQKLPQLPLRYLQQLAPPVPKDPKPGKSGGGNEWTVVAEPSKVGSDNAKVVNTGVNAALQKRWAKSGCRTMKDLLDKRKALSAEVPLPKGSNDKEVCLSWMLKGACYANCGRKAVHETANGATLTKVHGFLDALAVPKSDE